jgi:hypothetical protein
MLQFFTFRCRAAAVKFFFFSISETYGLMKAAFYRRNIELFTIILIKSCVLTDWMFIASRNVMKLVMRK